MREQRNRRMLVLLAAVGVGLAAIMGLAPTAHSTDSESLEATATTINWNTDSRPEAAAATEGTAVYANALSQAFREASDHVLPSVVTIQSLPPEVNRPAAAEGQSQGEIPEELRNHPFLKDFFGDTPRRMPGQSGPKRRGPGMGSGVIVDSAGLILTNTHVVEGAGSLIVHLHDGREVEAVSWKTDPQTDIAVVRIEGTDGLVAAKIGDSDRLDVGDWVIAVGAPFGLDETVTAGIISAKSRGIGMHAREDFLQTDAAINPGNSGGPLVNLHGEVVGINTAISSTSGGYQGVGFAVPINLARWIGDQLVSSGSVQRAFLGVGVQEIDGDLAKQFNLQVVQGALVTNIQPESPAARAGVQPGDVIVEFDGASVENPRGLQGRVERADVEKPHELTLIRSGKRLTLNVRVRQQAGSESGSAPASEKAPQKRVFEELGLGVSTLTPEVAGQLGVEAQGVVVTSVRPGSPAARAGLTPSLVISRVGQSDVQTVEELRSALQQESMEKGVLLLVHGRTGSRFVVLR